MFKEFDVEFDLDNLTPRMLLDALSKIPEDMLDDIITVDGDQPEKMKLFMAIDDHEDARPKWRRGDPDYVLFLNFKKGE